VHAVSRNSNTIIDRCRLHLPFKLCFILFYFDLNKRTSTPMQPVCKRTRFYPIPEFVHCVRHILCAQHFIRSNIGQLFLGDSSLAAL
jgi:hypothetical protein